MLVDLRVNQKFTTKNDACNWLCPFQPGGKLTVAASVQRKLRDFALGNPQAQYGAFGAKSVLEMCGNFQQAMFGFV